MARRRMIVWRGPSEVDGSPLMVVATYDSNPAVSSSSNTKTGDMVQMYILRTDIHPMEVLKRGLDRSICDRCPHMSVASGGSGACYVQVGKAPASIYKAIQRDGSRTTKAGKPTRVGDSIPFDLEAFRGRTVRFGAYGDPAAVPFEIWDRIHSVAAHVTGYTHRWKAEPRFSKFCMASADSVAEGRQARKRGYRSFIVRAPGAPKPKGAVQCPASAEAGKRITCADCLQCGGTASGRTADITIMAHGASRNRFGNLPLSVVN